MPLLSLDSITLIDAFSASRARQNLLDMCVGVRTAISQSGVERQQVQERDGFPHNYDADCEARNFVVELTTSSEFVALMGRIKTGELSREMAMLEEVYGAQDRSLILVVIVRHASVMPLTEWCVAGFERAVIVYTIPDEPPVSAFVDWYDATGTHNFVAGDGLQREFKRVTAAAHRLIGITMTPGCKPKSMTLSFANGMTDIYGNKILSMEGFHARPECFNIDVHRDSGNRENDSRLLTSRDTDCLFGRRDFAFKTVRTVAIHYPRVIRYCSIPNHKNALHLVKCAVSGFPKYPALTSLSLNSVVGPRTYKIKSDTLRQIQLTVSAHIVSIDCPNCDFLSQSPHTTINFVGATDPATIDLYNCSKTRLYADSVRTVVKRARHLLVSVSIARVQNLVPENLSIGRGRNNADIIRIEANNLKSLVFYGATANRDSYAKFGNLRFAAPRLEELWVRCAGAHRKYTADEIPVDEDGNYSIAALVAEK
jgi:hypothetical protein